MTEEILTEQAAPAPDTAVAENGTATSATVSPPNVGGTGGQAPAPRRLRLDQLKPGAVVQGTVKNIAQFGAFIDIGAEQDGLVHISELSENRVRRVEDVVKPGQEVEVTILEVDRSRKRISLSMKPRYDVYERANSTDDDEGVLSPMQAAFQRAQEKQAAQGNATKNREKVRKEQDDLLSRTLQQHRTQK